MMSVRKVTALIWHLVKELQDRGVRQVGKTMVQKMMFLIGREIGEDFAYSMFHYGPFSMVVAQYIDYAEYAKAINVEWHDEKGFFITPVNSKGDSLSSLLTEEDKKVIKNVVEKYHKFSTSELSIITTALYLKDNFNVQDEKEMIRIVKSIKPGYSEERIGALLKEARILTES